MYCARKKKTLLIIHLLSTGVPPSPIPREMPFFTIIVIHTGGHWYTSRALILNMFQCGLLLRYRSGNKIGFDYLCLGPVGQKMTHLSSSRSVMSKVQPTI